MSPLLISLASLSAAPADVQGTRQQSVVIMSEDPGSRKYQDDWGYADSIIVGDTIYVSGVVASLRSGEKGYEAAYVRAFEEIAGILKRSGASWADVVEITSFHTDLVSQMPQIVEVKKRYVTPPYPAWTAVGVTRLIPSSGITEIRVIAVRKPATP